MWIIDLNIKIQYLPAYALKDLMQEDLRKEIDLTIIWHLEQEAFANILQFVHLFDMANLPSLVFREQQLFFQSALNDAFL
jgi:hypothetical protein